ncbi:hypothetical protein C8J56DRAFT_1060797 [Mycena floridula]|nr:hypothetical protein C8J56DRAFT_1060797 [Mycena floridula]
MRFLLLLPLFSAALFTSLLTWNHHQESMLYVRVLFQLSDYGETFTTGWPLVFFFVNDTKYRPAGV